MESTLPKRITQAGCRRASTADLKSWQRTLPHHRKAALALIRAELDARAPVDLEPGTASHLPDHLKLVPVEPVTPTRALATMGILNGGVLRPSSLDLLMECPGALRSPEGALRVNETGEAALVGTCVHEGMGGHVSTGKDPDARALCIEHDLEHKQSDVEFCLSMGVRAWKVVHADYGARPEVEVKVERTLPSHPSYRVRGTADVLHYDPFTRTLHVLDWKTSRAPGRYFHQLRAYAWAALAKFPDALGVKLRVVYLRTRTIVTKTYTVAALNSWALTVEARILDWDGVSYGIGRHCTFCPRVHECPARRERDRSAIANLGEFEQRFIDLPAPEKFEVYETLKRIEKLAKSAKGLVRKHVEEHGPIDSGDGRHLGFKIGTEKVIPDPAALESSLRGSYEFTDDDMVSVTSLSLSKVEKLVRSRANGTKKAASAALYSHLYRDGLVTKAPGRITLEVQTTPKEKTSE